MVSVALEALEEPAELVAPVALAVWGESVAREAWVVLEATGRRNGLQAATMRGNTILSIGVVLHTATGVRRIGMAERRAGLH